MRTSPRRPGTPCWRWPGTGWTTRRLIAGVQEAHPELCHRVRYEDLVEDTEGVMRGVYAFLGVSPAPGIARRVFHRRARAVRSGGSQDLGYLRDHRRLGRPGRVGPRRPDSPADHRGDQRADREAGLPAHRPGMGHVPPARRPARPRNRESTGCSRPRRARPSGGRTAGRHPADPAGSHQRPVHQPLAGEPARQVPDRLPHRGGRRHRNRVGHRPHHLHPYPRRPR